MRTRHHVQITRPQGEIALKGTCTFALFGSIEGQGRTIAFESVQLERECDHAHASQHGTSMPPPAQARLREKVAELRYKEYACPERGILERKMHEMQGAQRFTQLWVQPFRTDRSFEGDRMAMLPGDRLDPRVKNVWRINDAIWITAGALIALATAALFAAIPETAEIGQVLIGAFAALAAVLYMLFLAVLPPIRYARWSYRISPEFLDIRKGIIWRKHYVIPFIRVQNTDTRQGPILRAFGLSSVTVATAAANHEIPGLDSRVADELRDRAAELARLAREDV